MDPLQNPWQIEQDEIRRPSLVHIAMLGLLVGLGIVVGTFGSLAIPIGFVSLFWPGQAVQSIGGIWFGGWGGLAAGLFPLVSNAISGAAPLPVSVAYVPGNFLQGMIAAWAFRRTSANPALLRSKDWIVWILGGAIIPNLVGAAYGTAVLVYFGLITPQARLVTFAGWFIGNTVPTLLLGSVVLKYVSPLVLSHRAFVKRIWA